MAMHAHHKRWNIFRRALTPTVGLGGLFASRDIRTTKPMEHAAGLDMSLSVTHQTSQDCSFFSSAFDGTDLTIASLIGGYERSMTWSSEAKTTTAIPSITSMA